MKDRSARTVSIDTVVLLGAILFGATFDRVRAQPPAPAGAPSRGNVVYEERCAECHGISGKGDGPASHVLNPRPRDFSAGKYKIHSTETGTPPTDQDLEQSVRQGLYGTSMPAWGKVLSSDDIQQVVAYIKTFAPRFLAEQPQPIPTSDPRPAEPESIARGWLAYQKLQCGKCHGDDGRGSGAVAAAFTDDWGQPLAATNLTEPWTFRGGATARDIYMRFRAGMSGTPMPSFKEAATDGEMMDLSNYVFRSHERPSGR